VCFCVVLIVLGVLVRGIAGFELCVYSSLGIIGQVRHSFWSPQLSWILRPEICVLIALVSAPSVAQYDVDKIEENASVI
jgi:hypothetical protein